MDGDQSHISLTLTAWRFSLAKLVEGLEIRRDDQIVPIGASAMLSSKMVSGATLRLRALTMACAQLIRTKSTGIS
jgi:hypothetical protein